MAKQKGKWGAAHPRSQRTMTQFLDVAAAIIGKSHSSDYEGPPCLGCFALDDPHGAVIPGKC